MKTVLGVLLVLFLLACLLGVAFLALVIGPNATLPALLALAMAQAGLMVLAIRTAIGLE